MRLAQPTAPFQSLKGTQKRLNKTDRHACAIGNLLFSLYDKSYSRIGIFLRKLPAFIGTLAKSMSFI